jgi:hypothetical protein
MTEPASHVWLQLSWLQVHGRNIATEPERVDSITEGLRGSRCPDLATALIEVLTWQRNHPCRCLVSAEIRDGCGGELLSSGVLS